MKQLLFIISFGFRLLIFSLVFGSISLQPMVESLYGSERQAFSWLDLDTENDSSKKESQETKEFKEFHSYKEEKESRERLKAKRRLEKQKKRSLTSRVKSANM